MLYSKILDLWIEEKHLEIRNSSYNNYLYTIKNRVKPELGDFYVEEITRKMLQEFIIRQSEQLKRETVINITKVLSQSFKYAVNNEYISESPYRGIKVPKDKCIKELKVFKPEEVARILSVNRFSEQKKNIVNIDYRTGMRIGEILVLKWEDINFSQNFLTVRRTLSLYNDGKPEISEPKTKGSQRRIDLDNVSMEIFKSTEKNGEYVFCKKDGSIFSRQAIYQSFKRMCKAANVPYHSFHSMRHTHASVLLSANVHPKIVQERLGHSNISTTLDTYSHLIPGMQQVAVDVFNNIYYENKY